MVTAAHGITCVFSYMAALVQLCIDNLICGNNIKDFNFSAILIS